MIFICREKFVSFKFDPERNSRIFLKSIIFLSRNHTLKVTFYHTCSRGWKIDFLSQTIAFGTLVTRSKPQKLDALFFMQLGLTHEMPSRYFGVKKVFHKFTDFQQKTVEIYFISRHQIYRSFHFLVRRLDRAPSSWDSQLRDGDFLKLPGNKSWSIHVMWGVILCLNTYWTDAWFWSHFQVFFKFLLPSKKFCKLQTWGVVSVTFGVR